MRTVDPGHPRNLGVIRGRVPLEVCTNDCYCLLFCPSLFDALIINRLGRQGGNGRFDSVLGVAGPFPEFVQVVGRVVLANSRLRAMAAQRCEDAGIRLRVPRPGLCTDNGAMVAALGSEMVARGRPGSGLDIPADSSLPVEVVAL